MAKKDCHFQMDIQAEPRNFRYMGLLQKVRRWDDTVRWHINNVLFYIRAVHAPTRPVAL